ncbi:MAG: amidohydrolase family protein [Armatimonadota bacterium]|jgi:hypothetical protein
MIIDYCAHCGDADVLRRAYNEMNRGYFEQDQVLKLARDAGIGVSVAAGVRNPKEGLISFATPDGSGELRLSDDVRGVRLLPTYQQWDFESERSEEILAEAGRRELLVQVCLRLQDPRVLRQNTVSAEALKSLADVVGRHKEVKFMVGGALLAEVSGNAALFGCDNVCVDIAHLQHPTGSLEKLVDIMGSERVAFASNSPIFYPKAAMFRVMHARLSDEARQRILERPL